MTKKKSNQRRGRRRILDNNHRPLATLRCVYVVYPSWDKLFYFVLSFTSHRGFLHAPRIPSAEPLAFLTALTLQPNKPFEHVKVSRSQLGWLHKLPPNLPHTSLPPSSSSSLPRFSLTRFLQ